MTTPAPSVRQDGTTPCWEVLRNGEAANEESNPHFDSHARAEVWLEELRAELAADADPLDDLPVLTIDLASPAPCWIAVCGSCDGRLESDEYGGTIHHPDPDGVLDTMQDECWHRGEDGLWRCPTCGPWPDPTPAEDRRPGPGQTAIEVGP